MINYKFNINQIVAISGGNNPEFFGKRALILWRGENDLEGGPHVYNIELLDPPKNMLVNCIVRYENDLMLG